MIISRTPFRISFFGGGTDYPQWFRQHGGAVIGATVNKFCYLSVRSLPPFFEHRHRIVYSLVELVREIGDIKHPAVRAVLQEMRVSDGLEIHHDADLPARSGLGSSSAFTVGLLNALHALNGRMVSKVELAREAIRIEQEVLRESVGCQDQIWAAYGGLNHIEFLRDGGFTVSPLVLPAARREELEQSLVLVFTGFSRIASEIVPEQLQQMSERQKQLEAMRAMVDDGLAILRRDNFSARDFGALMHESWRLKRELSKRIATTAVDEIYAAACEAGAYGGKLLGAGGGGFMLFVLPPEQREELRRKLAKLIHVAVRFDYAGSRIVVYEPDGLDQA
jgi:D-glycero-alpha-D-manno-heptose-7-phosphate kinase